MTSGTVPFKTGYSAMFTASRRNILKGARRLLYPSKQPGENTAVSSVLSA